MKEAYVSYEVAKLLKEKGFDWECRAYWHEDDRELIESQSPCHLRNITNPCWFGNTAPTQQMALCWLREEHYIDIIPVIRHSLKYAQESPFRDYACRVYDSDGKIVMSATKWYSRYERAVDVALEYCLTNLI